MLIIIGLLISAAILYAYYIYRSHKNQSAMPQLTKKADKLLAKKRIKKSKDEFIKLKTRKKK